MAKKANGDRHADFQSGSQCCILQLKKSLAQKEKENKNQIFCKQKHDTHLIQRALKSIVKNLFYNKLNFAIFISLNTACLCKSLLRHNFFFGFDRLPRARADFLHNRFACTRFCLPAFQWRITEAQRGNTPLCIAGRVLFAPQHSKFYRALQTSKFSHVF